MKMDIKVERSTNWFSIIATVSLIKKSRFWIMVTCYSYLQELTEAASETVATTVTTETSSMVTESNEGTKIKEEVTETVTTVTTTTTSSTVETTISGIKGKFYEYVCSRKLFRKNLDMFV